MKKLDDHINKQKLQVVIIGGPHHNTLGVIRSLGEQAVHPNNINVLIVGNRIPDKNIISESKYVLKTKVSYCELDSEIIPWLLCLCRDRIRRVIVCCSDGSATEVMRNKETLSEFYYTPSTILDVNSLMSKEIQNDIALECGMTIPLGKLMSKTEVNQNWDVFPCITKPIKSTAGAGKSDIHVSNSEAEFKAVLINTKAELIQVQQFIKKEMEFQLIGCSLDAGKYIIIPGFTRIIRQPENTNTGYLVYSQIKELTFDISVVDKFIKKIGYSGLFSIEFIRDFNRNDYFLEINMRNDGNAYCVKTAGINLPYIWCYYNYYGNLPDIATTFDKPVWFMPDFEDFRMGIKAIGFFRWIKEFFRAKSHTIYNLRDMKPFWIAIHKRIFK